MIEVDFFPEGRKLQLEGPLTVKKLLKRLKILPQTALVIRDGRLLTSDLVIKDGDKIQIRMVTSRG